MLAAALCRGASRGSWPGALRANAFLLSAFLAVELEAGDSASPALVGDALAEIQARCMRHHAVFTLLLHCWSTDWTGALGLRAAKRGESPPWPPRVGMWSVRTESGCPGTPRHRSGLVHGGVLLGVLGEAAPKTQMKDPKWRPSLAAGSR